MFVLREDKTSKKELRLTVPSDQSFDALASALPESVHHEEQQGEDEEGRDAADDEPHPAGHRVKQAVSVCGGGGKRDRLRQKKEERKQASEREVDPVPTAGYLGRGR